MLRIRRMRTEDIPFAIGLSNQEHWGITGSDLGRLLRLTPAGCFIASDGAKKLGLTTATTYGRKLAWIGNVIVHKKYRGRHVGQSLVEHAVDFLKRSRIQNIALYCFREHVRFYENLGFLKDAQFVRMRRRPMVTSRRPTTILGPAPSLTNLLRADRRAFGADRSRLVRDVLARKVAWYIGSTHPRGNLSYLVVREYRDMCEVGPWVSFNPSRREAEQTLSLALHRVGKLPLEGSCLKSNAKALHLMQMSQFRILREGYRMYYEKRSRIGNDRAQYALGFLDKG